MTQNHDFMPCISLSCSSLVMDALKEASGGSVSGKKKSTTRNAKDTMDSDMMVTLKCPSKSASCGAKAKPKENPASSIPNEGARHFLGMTSERAESATAIQLTKPWMAPTA